MGKRNLKNYQKRITVTLSNLKVDELKEYADMANMSLSSFIRRLLARKKVVILPGLIEVLKEIKMVRKELENFNCNNSEVKSRLIGLELYLKNIYGLDTAYLKEKIQIPNNNIMQCWNHIKWGDGNNE